MCSLVDSQGSVKFPGVVPWNCIFLEGSSPGTCALEFSTFTVRCSKADREGLIFLSFLFFFFSFFFCSYGVVCSKADGEGLLMQGMRQ